MRLPPPQESPRPMKAPGKSASGRRTRTWRSALRAIASCRSIARANGSATRTACARSSAWIPDFLALVGDSADGYPGIAGIGRVSAARLIVKYGAIEEFPPAVLGERRALALLFKELATLSRDAELFTRVEEIRWRGPTDAFAATVARLGEPRLLARAIKASVATA
jgi:hypothetical protein